MVSLPVAGLPWMKTKFMAQNPRSQPASTMLHLEKNRIGKIAVQVPVCNGPISALAPSWSPGIFEDEIGVLNPSGGRFVADERDGVSPVGWSLLRAQIAVDDPR